MMRLIWLVFLGATSFAHAADWLDQSHNVFLNKKLNAVTSRYREFPVFWWNFVVIQGELSPEAGESLCRELRGAWDKDLAKLPCNLGPAELRGLTKDWLNDLPRRQKLPAKEVWDSLMNSALAKAAMPLPRELLNMLRLDPLDSLGALKARLDEHKPFDLPMQNGMFIDAADKQRWLPVQFNYSPADAHRTQSVLDAMPAICARTKGCVALEMFGPHSSTLENENRVREDINIVSWVGVISMVLLCVFVMFTRRLRLVYLIPILLGGLGIATLVTIWVFGSIHGITLAFGPGIVGLAMDYGVHAVFLNPRSRATWKSNLAGLLTTLVVLVILWFSEIPLLRQMMFYSAFGLIFSFALFYVILHKWPKTFETKPYNFSPKTWKLGEWVAIAWLVASPLVFFLPLNLSLSHLNYESERTQVHRRWFGQHATSLQPYWLEEDALRPLESAEKTKDWALNQHIPYEGVANFLPPNDVQAANSFSWMRFCTAREKPFTETQLKFFAPFFADFKCPPPPPLDLHGAIPDYLRDFAAQGHFASLLLPSTPEQIALVKEHFKGATTPREIFDEFPKIFVRELMWMVPLSLALAILFLGFHFRRVDYTLLSIVPFLTGVGCFALVAVAFQLPLSFISLIGLLMVFGFSLDYGIFVVDLLREGNENRFGVWSALSICSFSTLAGFAPMIFAGHPVLNDLGQTLLWGSFGTYVGTFWGIPGLYRWRFG